MDGAGSTNKQDGLQRINGAYTVRPFLFCLLKPQLVSRHFLNIELQIRPITQFTAHQDSNINPLIH
ncbi:hypothetical protein B4P00_14200 [Shewanella xiamenensis]|nr:hypothetical protein CEQ32_08105 [Shewanella sp. FDAARGOS_354]MBW0297376.1 hypothetical protein [Shewanella xiamenensis]